MAWCMFVLSVEKSACMVVGRILLLLEIDHVWGAPAPAAGYIPGVWVSVCMALVCMCGAVEVFRCGLSGCREAGVMLGSVPVLFHPAERPSR